MIGDTSPACMAQDKIEFFIMNDEIQYVRGGMIFLWKEAQEDVRRIMEEMLKSDKKAIAGLRDMEITDKEEQLSKFISCRFGDFDKKADTNEEGKFISEYWDCGQRPCPGDGRVCLTPSVPNGRLTPHESYIIRLISRDIPNKQIAAIMQRSVQTINRESKNIARKIGVFTKTGIARFAGEHGIF